MASSTSASASVRVEKATSDLLLAPDWTMNIDICDSINTDLWQAKDVIKAVKKRLQHKNPKVQFLVLTLLETMIKNCGDYVHAQVVERQILTEMVKIVKKKTDMQVREKILVLLDSWQEAFGGPGGKYPQYYWAYMDLKRVGVEFPQRSRDSSLIFSPPGSHPRLTSTHPGYGMPSNSPMRLDEAIASDIGNLSLSDLDGIRHVMELLNDMLQAVNPNDRAAVKDELIVDLVSQCRTNQRKLMQLVSSTGDEELLGEGLSLNDSLQSLLAKHDAITSGSPLPAEVPQSMPSPTAPVVEPITVAGNHSKEEEEDSEEDEFALLARRNRPTTDQSVSASENSPNHSDITTATTSSSVSDSSVASKALVLSDPPPAVRTSTMEQDMIELLSITLSTNSSPPQTPLTPSTSHQTESPVSTSSTEQVYPQNSPHFGNEGQIPSNSYVAPWAQQTPSQLQPVQLPPSQSPSPPQPTFQSQYQVPQYSSYPPPPWATPAIGQSNPFLSNPYQYPSTQFTLPAPAPAMDSRPLQQYNSFGRSSNASSSAGEAQMTGNQRQDSRPLQHYNSFGRSNNASALAGEAQMTANQRQGSGNAAKPFVPSYRLFEDLMDLRNTDERIKVRTQTSLSGTSGQGMIGGRK